MCDKCTLETDNKCSNGGSECATPLHLRVMPSQLSSEWVEKNRAEWRNEALPIDDLQIYRTNYDIPSWAACISPYVGLPIGAALAVERLCCEVERLSAALSSERERCAMVAEGLEKPAHRHWVPDSLYETIRREVASLIRRA